MTYAGSHNPDRFDTSGRSALRLQAAVQGDSLAGLVDPADVHINRWYGRPVPTWQAAKLDELKRDIATTGGNVVPVLGRLASESSSIELVYGSLRTQACLELGLPVFIVVRDMPVQDGFATMIREGSRGWAPFELGMSIERALNAGLFPSSRRLAAACGLPLEVVHTTTQVARLPVAVVEAFGSPAKLTWSAANRLVRAFNSDPEAVKRRALALEPGGSSKHVLAALLGERA